MFESGSIRVRKSSDDIRCIDDVDRRERTEQNEGHEMNKSELIDAVASQSGVSKADAGKTIDAFFEVLTSALKSGDKVSWPGFGSFSTSESAARTGRNPQTGEAVDIAASTRMKFTPSSTLKGELNPNRK